MIERKTHKSFAARAFFLYSDSMKNKIVVAVFSSVIAVLVAVLALRLFVFTEPEAARPKIITPVTDASSLSEAADSSRVSDNSVQTSFIPLRPTETLMETLTLDFDGDNLDDQVIAVHKAGSPYLFLIVGLYNPDTNAYDRVAEISTEISKVKTFSYNSLDVIGDHRNALVYQGMKNNGDSVMRIYLCRKRRGSVELQNIGDFSSDGTIFILQTERSEAYELSQAKGASYSVWVYSSDKSDANDTTGVNQVQTEYKWDADSQTYRQARQLHVKGSRIAAKELARIQNGTVETFAQFLNGLWYKTTTTGSVPLYIYFDYDSKEVIFLSDDTEGVYSWEDSSLRRSGIYLTVVNTVIPSMKRRFDIMLSGMKEVNIHVHDNVGMIIKESTQWDGAYKKMSFQSTFGEAKKEKKCRAYAKILMEENSRWKDDDERLFSFGEGVVHVVNGESETNAVFVLDDVGEFPIVQFREFTEQPLLQTTYVMQFRTYEVEVPAKNRRSKPTKRTETDTSTVILTPVRFSPSTCYPTDGRTIILHRQ